MILVPSTGPDDWRRLLAQPERQWRDGYSAKMLAERWEAASGVPAEVAALFPEKPEVLVAIPELKTPIPGGSRETQTDLWVLMRIGRQTVSVAVEGKVDEPFGPTIAEWLVNASEGKRTRLKFLCDVLGLGELPDPSLRYQLLHRTAAALIEGERFKVDEAALIVHSFSKGQAWRGDFNAFAAALAPHWTANGPVRLKVPDGRTLTLAWAAG